MSMPKAKGNPPNRSGRESKHCHGVGRVGAACDGADTRAAGGVSTACDRGREG